MEQPNLSFFPKIFSTRAISAYLILLILCTLLFFQQRVQMIWILFGLAEVITFFYFTNQLTLRWSRLPEKLFVRKLFQTTMIIRVVFVFFIYFFFKGMTGEPFEFEAADSKGYHGEALWILDLLDSGELGHYFHSYLKGYSDSGWPVFLSFVYLLTFRSILAARLVNAVFSVWMVILIYRLASRNFGRTAARISAIMAMLLPNFIYYTGLHLKETLMIFLLVAFAERADYLIRTRSLSVGNIFVVIFLGTLLFFFRTVLAAAAWFSLLSALLLSSQRIIGKTRRFVSIILIAIGSLFIFSGTILMEVEGYLYERETNLDAQMNYFSKREGGNKLTQYGSQSVFLPLVLFGPFPSMVSTNQPNANMINGNLFTRNVFVFFVIVALWVLYKQKLFKDHILILVLLFSYLFILSASGFALSERFHLPILPFLLILAGYGMTKMNKRYVKQYIPYLILIGIIVIGWNWFKLAGRGAV